MRHELKEMNEMNETFNEHYIKVDTGKFPQVKVPKIKLDCNNFQKTQVAHYACA